MQLLSVPMLQEFDVFFSTSEQFFGNCIHAGVSEAVFLELEQGSRLAADGTSQFMKLAVEPESLQLLGLLISTTYTHFFTSVQESLLSLTISLCT